MRDPIGSILRDSLTEEQIARAVREVEKLGREIRFHYIKTGNPAEFRFVAKDGHEIILFVSKSGTIPGESLCQTTVSPQETLEQFLKQPRQRFSSLV